MGSKKFLNDSQGKDCYNGIKRINHTCTKTRMAIGPKGADAQMPTVKALIISSIIYGSFQRLYKQTKINKFLHIFAA